MSQEFHLIKQKTQLLQQKQARPKPALLHASAASQATINAGSSPDKM